MSTVNLQRKLADLPERRVIQFYLELIATPDNISLIYNLAAKAKTVRDADSHTHSEVSPQLLSLTFQLDFNLAEPICDVRVGPRINKDPCAQSFMERYKLPWEG